MTDERLSIQLGGVGDLDAVMQVMDDCFDPAFGEAWTAAQCAGLLPMPGVWLALARRDGAVIGFSLARTVAGEAELMLLAVCRARQHDGIGSALLDAFIDHAAKRGAARVHLEVRDGNRAIKLYRKSGFREVGRRRDYYTGCDNQLYDALTLARTLPT